MRIKFSNNSLDFHIFFFIEEKWCFSNILELIRRALVDVMLACCLSFVFLSVLGFRNAFGHRPVLPENFSKLFRNFFPISYSKSIIFGRSKILFHGHQKLYLD
jgi:hypothetical protein